MRPFYTIPTAGNPVPNLPQQKLLRGGIDESWHVRFSRMKVAKTVYTVLPSAIRAALPTTGR